MSGVRPTAQSGPAEAPETPRRLVIPLGHAVGLALLFLVPLAALFGVFGRTSEATAVNSVAELRVKYPRCARHGAPAQLEISLRNLTDAAVRSVELRASAGYFERFSNVTSSPDVRTIAREFVFAPSPPAPREQTAVLIDLRPDRSGWAHCRVVAGVDQGEPLALEFSTFVFP